jgi:hypothetical protein
MAEWQVEFHIVPKRALSGAPSLRAGLLDATDWWSSGALPPDYRERFASMAAPTSADPSTKFTLSEVEGLGMTTGRRGESPELESWGPEDGNRVEVRSQDGRARSVRIRLDVRRPDAKFAAGVITFARVANAAIVRSDGTVIEPNAGGFGVALRSSPAWQFVKEPLGPSATGYRDLPDDDE